MKYRNRKITLAWLAVIICFGIGYACDPGVTLHLVRKDLKPMSCPDHAEMTFTVYIQYKDGEKFVDTFDVDKKANHPTVGMLKGGIERTIAWVQFKLYCGETDKPVLVTPQIILPKDLVKKDDLNYYYYVDWK